MNVGEILLSLPERLRLRTSQAAHHHHLLHLRELQLVCDLVFTRIRIEDALNILPGFATYWQWST